MPYQRGTYETPAYYHDWQNTMPDTRAQMGGNMPNPWLLSLMSMRRLTGEPGWKPGQASPVSYDDMTEDAEAYLNGAPGRLMPSAIRKKQEGDLAADNQDAMEAAVAKLMGMNQTGDSVNSGPAGMSPGPADSNSITGFDMNSVVAAAQALNMASPPGIIGNVLGAVSPAAKIAGYMGIAPESNLTTADGKSVQSNFTSLMSAIMNAISQTQLGQAFGMSPQANFSVSPAALSAAIASAQATADNALEAGVPSDARSVVSQAMQDTAIPSVGVGFGPNVGTAPGQASQHGRESFAMEGLNPSLRGFSETTAKGRGDEGNNGPAAPAGPPGPPDGVPSDQGTPAGPPGPGNPATGLDGLGGPAPAGPAGPAGSGTGTGTGTGTGDATGDSSGTGVGGASAGASGQSHKGGKIKGSGERTQRVLGGEYVVNKDATSKFEPLLRSINTATQNHDQDFLLNAMEQLTKRGQYNTSPKLSGETLDSLMRRALKHASGEKD